MKRVLLTGAFGNLGVATINELLREGHAVRCFDIPSKVNKKRAERFGNRLDIFWGDIRDANRVKQAVADQDAIIHNAAVLPPVTEKKKELAWAINVEGTRSILQAAEESPKKPLIIYSSSVSAYGPSKDRIPPLKATDPLNPTDQYTTHKAECEKMLRESRIPWVILRVGVALDPNARDANEDSFRTMFNVSPETRFEYVHPLDVAIAQAKAVQAPDAVNKVFLIGGGKSCQVTYRDLFEAIFDAIGIGMLPRQAFGNDPFYTDWMDTAESQRTLNYQFRSFDDYRRDLRRSMQLIRWSIFPVRPLVRWVILRYSAPWQNRKNIH